MDDKDIYIIDIQDYNLDMKNEQGNLINAIAIILSTIMICFIDYDIKQENILNQITSLKYIEKCMTNFDN